MRLDETSAICRSLINNLKPRNVEVNYIYNYGNSSIISLNLEHVKDYSWKEELV